MKIKNIIPYFIAHELFDYECKYAESILKGYSQEIQDNILKKDYYLGELDIIFYMAITNKRLNIIKFFSEKKISISMHKKMFVDAAAEKNYSFIIENYLKVKKPKSTDKFLWQILQRATLHSCIDVVELLLKYGVDFKQDNYECIRMVLKANNFELFKLFHKYGLEINKNEYIFASIMHDNKDWFNYLLKNEFTINQLNQEVIYAFMGFNGSLNILEEQKSNLMDEKELMFRASNYNPLVKKWLEAFYKKVDFYQKLNKKFVMKSPTEINKVKKI